jgi:phosphopantothenoylcysteine decarboxylase/phosphopantothenate--cysteine ligase
MPHLSGQRILIGITGGIAAYKAIHLIRLLKTAQADVQVVMTKAACQFISPLTVQAISGNKVHTELFDSKTQDGMDHIHLAQWAECVIIAPATANCIARLAHGLADDLLSTLCLATKASLIIAPAMNHQMWQHPATQTNILTLQERGARIIGPDVGIQACGDVGVGRMVEPEAIVAALTVASKLTGVKVMVTAGATREPLDPVRYLTNRSSGRMGYAIAQALIEQGAEVLLISGQVALPPPPGVKRITVETALEMYQAVMEKIADYQIFISAAAVADYRPELPCAEKLKKTADTLTLNLVRNPDILSNVAARSQPPFTVGFAAETQNLETYARKKLQNKRLNMIAANLVGNGQGFEALDNALLVLWNQGKMELPMQPKLDLARQLVKLIASVYNNDI